jgi:gliding motility-associated-like protein|tara:strand:- start:31 stop:570 length:540 start_codon:yes stop_codon:yes gene_type:complete
MRLLLFILLPFSLFSQETYDNCENIPLQYYQVEYDIGKEYYWNISGGAIAYSDSNTLTVQWPNEVGTYIISVYTTTFDCDGDTSYYEVKIEDCPSQIFIPNSFTPSRDNINETFYVHGVDKDEIKSFIIYNRWGEIVYEVNDNTPWDGTYKGKNCQIGTYTYSVKTWGEHYIGTVNLIR